MGFGTGAGTNDLGFVFQAKPASAARKFWLPRVFSASERISETAWRRAEPLRFHALAFSTVFGPNYLAGAQQNR